MHFTNTRFRISNFSNIFCGKIEGVSYLFYALVRVYVVQPLQRVPVKQQRRRVELPFRSGAGQLLQALREKIFLKKFKRWFENTREIIVGRT